MKYLGLFFLLSSIYCCITEGTALGVCTRKEDIINRLTFCGSYLPDYVCAPIEREGVAVIRMA